MMSYNHSESIITDKSCYSTMKFLYEIAFRDKYSWPKVELLLVWFKLFTIEFKKLNLANILFYKMRHISFSHLSRLVLFKATDTTRFPFQRKNDTSR